MCIMDSFIIATKLLTVAPFCPFHCKSSNHFGRFLSIKIGILGEKKKKKDVHFTIELMYEQCSHADGCKNVYKTISFTCLRFWSINKKYNSFWSIYNPQGFILSGKNILPPLQSSVNKSISAACCSSLMQVLGYMKHT